LVYGLIGPVTKIQQGLLVSYAVSWYRWIKKQTVSTFVHGLKYDITVAGINHFVDRIVPIHASTYMKKIHGPTYRYNGEVLTNPELILVSDHHYNELDRCDHVAQLLAASPCRHLVFFDHVVQQDILDFECFYFPTLLARECLEFSRQEIKPYWQEKTHAFNFMINKPRNHRLLLLHMINELGLTNYCHSLCWEQSPVESVSVTNYLIGDEVVMEKGVRNGSYINAITYQALLQKNVFEPSCVSLITEPAYYERETIVTEKTIMSIYGGTVPIWVGGWRIPDYMTKMKFDIFDDIVDHSYQKLDCPEQRVRRAIVDNIDLLMQPIQVDLARLQHNLDLVNANPWLSQVNSLIETYPELRTGWPA
jgi:hypothetical protein